MFTHGAHCYVWKSKEIELVDPRYDDSPHQSQNPCSKRARRHIGVVCIRYGGTNFRIGGFVLCTKFRKEDALEA